VRKKRTKTNYNKRKNISVLTFKTHDRVYEAEIDRIEDKSKKSTKQNSQLKKEIKKHLSQLGLIHQPCDHMHKIWIILKKGKKKKITKNNSTKIKY
jgi:hypothetical protein